MKRPKRTILIITITIKRRRGKIIPIITIREKDNINDICGVRYKLCLRKVRQ